MTSPPDDRRPGAGRRGWSGGSRSFSDGGVHRGQFVVSPFSKLARVHALSAAGDALVAIALAGSLFFTTDPGSARGRTALYLVLTMAPFAVVAPLIGPAIDRMAGGRRLMIFVANAGRALACALIIGHIDSLMLFPLAFVVLVLAKGYAVARSAMVPTVVRSEAELVEANSKLGLLAGILGGAAAVPGVLLLKLFGGSGVVAGAAVVFVLAAIASWALPRTTVAARPATQEERAELRTGVVLLAAGAMASVRACVGFLTFLVAFSFRRDDIATIWFGVVLLFSALGSLAGSAVAPAIRRSTREETMIVGTLALVAAVGVIAAVIAGPTAAAVLAAAVGFGASFAKLAFDSIVQRDAPDANKGRSLAQFEAKFQITWVAAAFVPVVVPIPAWAGYLLLAGLCLASGFVYLVGMKALRHKGRVPQPLGERVGRVARAELARRRAALREARRQEAEAQRAARGTRSEPSDGAEALPPPSAPAGWPAPYDDSYDDR